MGPPYRCLTPTQWLRKGGGGGWHPGMACLFGDGCFAIINKKHRFSRMSSLRQPTGLGSFTPGRKETNVSLTSPVACVDIIGSHGAGVPTRIRPEAADEYLAAAEPIRSRGLVPLWDAGSRFLPSAEPPRRATAPSARQLAKCTNDSVTNPRKLNRSLDGIQWSEDGHGLGCFSGVGH